MPIQYCCSKLQVWFPAVPYLVLLLAATASWAQSPSLGDPRALLGGPTAARYFGGSQIVSSGRGGYSTAFGSQDTLTVTAEIHIDPAHVGAEGNLYVVASLGNALFMRDSLGSYIGWDGDISRLKATTRAKPLAAIEPLDILQNVSVGRLGIEGQQPKFFLGYNLNNDANELYYHGQPLSFSVASYDPLAISGMPIQIHELVIEDSSRGRQIPLFVYLPEAASPRPVVLFSHGLGGNLRTATYLGMHWASRGYVVVFMQHPGSDEAILDDVPASQLLATLNAAASLPNLDARIRDVTAVIDQLEVLTRDASHSLSGRLNMDLVAMTGHSYGAKTTQAVSGENLPAIARSTRDPRIKTAIAFSPSSPDPENSAPLFSEVDIPWLLMTGTEDTAVIGHTTVADRLAVYPALPPGGKYELVLFEGEHHAFTDREISTTQNSRNPLHHDIIKALSTAFLDAWLSEFPQALRWLEGEGARSVVLPMDSWQFK